MAGDGDEPGRMGGEVVLHAGRGADGVVDDEGVQSRRLERPLFAETTKVLVGVLVGSVVASPRGADAHRGRAGLGDGHDGELHAEGVGPGRGDRQPALGGGGPVDAGDEMVDPEWWCRRLVLGVRVDDEGAGDDDRVRGRVR